MRECTPCWMLSTSVSSFFMMKIIILCTPTNNYSFAFTASTTSLRRNVSSSYGIGGSSSNSRYDRIGIGNNINRRGIWILSADGGGGGGALGKKAYNDNALFNFHMSKQVVVRL